jgi:hypothetical protein
MADRIVKLYLTHPQARAINSALALLDADEEMTSLHGVQPNTMSATRHKVWGAMEGAGCEP